MYDEYIQDVLTALCYVRMLPLKVGVEYVLDDRSGYSSWPLTVKVLRKEAVRTNLSRFDVLQLSLMYEKMRIEYI